ncbi:MAG: adenylate/guanylate cyclase domain-containing protein [bacterium]|nr:adenylate/guanylate cyclase domain-containing protein [bacterium]
MSARELHFTWEWHLQSSPEALWPLVSDTNHFNHDTGAQALEKRADEPAPSNARRLLRIMSFGMPFEWVEEPYEWVQPHYYRTARHYTKGLVEEVHVLTELIPEGSGTHLRYTLTLRPRTRLARVLLGTQIKLNSGRIYEKTFQTYDQKASRGELLPLASLTPVEFVPGGETRLQDLAARLRREGAQPALVEKLTWLVENGDDLVVARIRPYALADQWNVSRRALLETCLLATRVGLLDLQWDLLCPNCRGAKATATTLSGVVPEVHCDMCNIDFTVNFDRSVELTFKVNAAVRLAETGEFCIAGPQTTPHVVVQQLMKAGEVRSIQPVLEPGRYRLRALNLRGGQYLNVAQHGHAELTLTARDTEWDNSEPAITPDAKLTWRNDSREEQLMLLERVAWSDQAVTAAEVTTMQLFRDLFAKEALRPGDQISVGKLTILFTDLRGSTSLYREIGDAPAFGLVMNHFDILRDAISAEGGAIVKTIGDAVMAAFPQPDAALRAALAMQHNLMEATRNERPLKLKIGVHTGACIAVTLNDRLDYFGSTVNLAARLEGQSTGEDVVISNEMYNDSAVRDLLSRRDYDVAFYTSELKGFADEQFRLWRVRRAPEMEKVVIYPG